MTATQYFTTPKLQLQPANFEKAVMQTTKKVLVKSFIAKNKPIDEQECHRLNHIIVTLLSLEIASSLLVLSERRIISAKDVKYFDKLAGNDVDYIENGYRKAGQIEHFTKDFELVVNTFNTLAAKSVSEFQAKSDPVLVDLLALIYGIKHIQTAIPILCRVVGKVPMPNTMRILREKILELEAAFMKRYAEVSNSRTFDFNRFQKTFVRIAGMTNKEFTEFTEELK